MPNVGKSTLFNTLTKLSIPAENFPFCTIEPNEARVNIPDERFEWLCQLFKPKSEVYFLYFLEPFHVVIERDPYICFQKHYPLLMSLKLNLLRLFACVGPCFGKSLNLGHDAFSIKSIALLVFASVSSCLDCLALILFDGSSYYDSLKCLMCWLEVFSILIIIAKLG